MQPTHPAQDPVQDKGESIRIERRGRDLALVPPKALESEDDARLLTSLFGADQYPVVKSLLVRDRRSGCFRARPLDYAFLKAALERHSAHPVELSLVESPFLPGQPRVQLVARPYQEDALACWRAENYRGVVVLPTGGGKTFIGGLAIADLGVWSLVVVPTIDLLHQWRDALCRALGYAVSEIGSYGGGDHELRPITITTYESAAQHPELLWHFGLLIFDECHHLPAPTYRQIAEGAFTPYRLGLSATPERSDLEHVALERLIGPLVYRRQPQELAAEGYLAQYEEQRLTVVLDSLDRGRYEAARRSFRGYLARRNLRLTSPADFQRKILWPSARDPEARSAMLAWREARSLALNAPAKLALLEELFARHQHERVLVFSEYNSVVDEISERFCIPQITYKTPVTERQLILERFRSGRYTKLVSGRVLNEGLDVPDCGVAVIVSGTSTRREYIQRLGRVLRPKERHAILYELVTEDTTEERIASERRGLARGEGEG
ncbi:MAG: DEAD/DEAH box helicase [Ktedonobacterales bacterium]